MKLKLANISIEVTSECNLNCKYCYNHWKVTGNDYYSNSYKKTINTLKRIFKCAEVETVTFTGGEPFMSERFEEVVLFTRLQKKKVNIITNGNICTDAQIEKMIKMGVQLFELPMHSKRPEVHDSMTTVNGSWLKTYNSINSIIKKNGYVVPVVIITKFNFKYIEETIEFIHSLGLRRIMINRFNIGGNGIKAKEELLLSGKELSDTFSLINTLSSKFDLVISSNVCTPLCVINPTDYSNIAFGNCPSNVLYRPLTLDIDGNLRLCNHSPINVGNIFKTEVKEILNSEYVAKWTNIKPSFCSNCDKFEKCLGGCRAASEQLNQPLSFVDPILQNEKSFAVNI